MSAPRVIMFEPVKQDLHNVHSFGELYYLSASETLHSRPSLFDTGVLTSQILAQLSAIDYNPDTDVIVTTGPILAVCILVAAVASYYGRFEALCFNAKESAYIQRRLGQNDVIE